MILLIDNYDSFTYNIAQALGILGRELVVKRNDKVTVEEIGEMAPEAIFISPGPGRPDDAGVSREVIREFAGKVPIMGVCLGHQVIGEVFGAQVTRAAQPVHGKVSEVFHDGRGLFAGLRNPFKATRYHSLIVPEDTVAEPLSVSAYTSDGEVMGLRSSELMLEGVQFHPESIATAQGMMIFKNFLELYLDGSVPTAATAGAGR